MDFITTAQQCAPTVHPMTMAAIVRVESGYNPYAIGVVGARLARQPRDKAEALETLRALRAAGYNFSVGISQINRYNFQKYGLDDDKALDPCESLRVGAEILTDCFQRARLRTGDKQQALLAAFSCYYSGNFKTGFNQDIPGQPSYVQKILNNATKELGRVEATSAIPGTLNTRHRLASPHRSRAPSFQKREDEYGIPNDTGVYSRQPGDFVVSR